MRLRGWGAALATAATLGGAALAAPPTVGDGEVHAVLGQGVRVVRDPLSGAVRGLFGVQAPTTGDTVEARAQGFVRSVRRVLSLDAADVAPLETQPLPDGGHAVHLQETALGGVPVEGHSLTVRLDADGVVRGVTSDVVSFPLAHPPMTIAPAAAKAVVDETFAVALIGTPTEVVWVAAPQMARLAWRVPVAVIPLQAHFWVWVDAENGAVLHDAPAGLDQTMTRLPRKEASR